jgi:hypothetical protein
VPNCYYVSSSSPGQTVRDLRECVASVGRPGEVVRNMTDGARVHSWVHYDELRDAMRCLNLVKRCMEEKGHRVHKAEILHEFEEAGLSEEE